MTVTGLRQARTQSEVVAQQRITQLQDELRQALQQLEGEKSTSKTSQAELRMKLAETQAQLIDLRRERDALVEKTQLLQTRQRVPN